MLITTRLSFLQQIQKSAVSGYRYYVTSSIDIQNLPSLIKKFQKRYQINETRQQAYRRRQRDEASAKFYCYADESDSFGQKIFWVLLLTEGKHMARQEEVLKDLRLKQERFSYSDYQLIQKPSDNGKQKYTYQLLHESNAFYQNEIRKAIRNKNISKLNKLIEHFNMMPGFAGVRDQKKKLKSILDGEVKKYLNSKQQEQVHGMTNFYHRQQKLDHVKSLSVFIQQMKEHDLTIKQQLKSYRSNKDKRGKNLTQKPEQKTGLIRKLFRRKVEQLGQKPNS